MKVVVKWQKSPRQLFGIPRAKGTYSELDVSVAKEIRKKAPEMFVSSDLDAWEKKESIPEVKDTMQKKVRTRPVEKDS